MKTPIYRAHGFVDGAYLRKLADDAGLGWPDPLGLIRRVVSTRDVQGWGSVESTSRLTALARVTYYDARPDSDSDIPRELADYWNEVELLPDTDLGFGTLRGGTKRRPPRQKGVDTLIAVDMLVGAFSHIYDIGVLVAGDADFVPVVNEVRRRGVMVAVVAERESVAADLRRAADRFAEIRPKDRDGGNFPLFKVDGRQFGCADSCHEP